MHIRTTTIVSSKSLTVLRGVLRGWWWTWEVGPKKGVRWEVNLKNKWEVEFLSGRWEDLTRH